MQVGKLGAAARKTMRPFFVWWVARCFLSVGLWGFGPVGQICKCSKYTSVYMYMYLCLFAESWVFHGIQGNTPGTAHALSADNPSLMYIGNSGLCGPPLQKNVLEMTSLSMAITETEAAGKNSIQCPFIMVLYGDLLLGCGWCLVPCC